MDHLAGRGCLGCVERSRVGNEWSAAQTLPIADATTTVIVVEHWDPLVGLCFEQLEAAFSVKGRRVVVVGDAGVDQYPKGEGPGARRDQGTH